MSSEKPNFLSQPVVKNIFMYRNGDPYYEARRIVINEKRVCNFETLLREVTGGIQAPFGAVRNIYTPRGGHKVDSMESLQSGEQYVAAGKERFKKLDYLQIGSRKKRMMQTLPMQARLVPQNRIIVSARFLKPIKEPCTIFVVANGDTLNPAVRILIHQRMLGQFERILEMITEKMGLRVLGGVRSLYTYEGQQVTEGNLLESGQLYVAVGREKFKRLPYIDLLFPRPRGTRRVKGMKAYYLPPLYRYSKQSSENSKSMTRCSDSGDGDSKASPPNHNGNSKENLSSIVREISRARLLSYRKRKSGQSFTLGTSDSDDPISKSDDGNTDDKSPQEEKAEEKSDASGDLEATEENDDAAKATEEKDDAPKATEEKDDAPKATEGKGGEAEKATEEKDDGAEKEESAPKNASEEDSSASKDNMEEDQKIDVEKVEENKEADEQNDGKIGETTPKKEKVEEGKEDVKEEVPEESKKEVKSETQGTNSPNSDKTQDNKEKGDGSHSSFEAEMEPDKDKDEDKQDEDSGNKEKSSNDHINDVDTGREQKETENSSPDKTQSDNETIESGNSGSSNSNQEEDVRKTTAETSKESGEEGRVNGEVTGDDEKADSKPEPEKKNSDSCEDAAANGEKGNDADGKSQGKNSIED